MVTYGLIYLQLANIFLKAKLIEYNEDPKTAAEQAKTEFPQMHQNFSDDLIKREYHRILDFSVFSLKKNLAPLADKEKFPEFDIKWYNGKL